MSRRGFTLIEVLIVLVIIIVVSVVAILRLPRENATSQLTSVGDEMQALLREAQSDAAAGKDNTVWGVHFENASGSPFFALFSSSTYTTTSLVGKYPLPSSLKYLSSTLPVGSSTDIIFSPITGGTTVASVTLTIANDPSQTLSICVSSVGAVVTPCP